MSGQNNSIEKAFKQLEDLEGKIEQDQQEAEEAEEELKHDEQRTEKAEKAEKEEIEEGESTGNVNEIEDAEKKMEKILQMLKKEEKEADQITRDIEEELKLGGQVEQKIESLEGTAERDFKEANQNLRKIISNFKNIQSSSRDFAERNFRAAEDTLEEIRFSAEIFRRVLQHEERLVQELNRVEKEEGNLEHLAGRLHKELEMDKKEIKELLVDSKHIQIPEDVEKAEMEGKELSQLLKHWNSEEAELEKVDEQIKRELKELRKLLGEDEQILQEMENCLHNLENLEQLLQDEKGVLKFMADDSSARTVIKDIDTTRNKLQSQLKKERNMTDKIESEFSKLKDNAPSGKAVGGTAARASMTVGKLLVTIIVVVFIAAMVYMSGFGIF